MTLRASTPPGVHTDIMLGGSSLAEKYRRDKLGHSQMSLLLLGLGMGDSSSVGEASSDEVAVNVAWSESRS